MAEEIELDGQDDGILDRLWDGPRPMGAASDCRTCSNYRDDRRCLAYPAGIPSPLWSGTAAHRKPFSGDGGIVYQPSGSDAGRWDKIAKALGIRLRPDK